MLNIANIVTTNLSQRTGISNLKNLKTYNNIMLKHYCISCEGIDKSGKEIIGKYINILGKYKYVLMDRGLLSNITYARMNYRDYEYNLDSYTNWIIVYLIVDKEDWKVRCKLANEPEIDYDLHMKEFNRTAFELDKAGIPIFVYNTSVYTPYSIAKDIIRCMEDKEKEDNEQSKSDQPSENAVSASVEDSRVRKEG